MKKTKKVVRKNLKRKSVAESIKGLTEAVLLIQAHVLEVIKHTVEGPDTQSIVNSINSEAVKLAA